MSAVGVLLRVAIFLAIVVPVVVFVVRRARNARKSPQDGGSRAAHREGEALRGNSNSGTWSGSI